MAFAYLVGKKKKKFIPPVVDDSGSVYGVRISSNTYNPTLGVTYIEDSTGFAPASGGNGNFDYGSWNNKFPFNKIRPCVMRNSEVVTYLNPNDYTKDVQGNYVPLASLDGNVMIEIPKIYYKIETTSNLDIEIRYSGTKVDDSYKCYAHSINEEERDYLYIGAFLSSSSYSRSLPTYTITTGGTLANLRQSAKTNRGLNGRDGYALMGYNQLVLLQSLFLVMFKSRDYKALGMGKATGTTASSRLPGGTLTKGLFYGSDDTTDRVKFCGIEDFYGNYECLIDGCFTGTVSNNNVGLIVGYDHTNFNNDGIGYVSYQGTGALSRNTIVEVKGTTELGFAPSKVETQTGNAYWVNKATLTGGRYMIYGGYTGSTNGQGLFKMDWILVDTSLSVGNNTTTRLMYL